jgi:NAD(P)-dependent dehydrogenase (short-subunit alcohol dehydrogenase family)
MNSKDVVVTGVSTGIGWGTTKVLVSNGFRVVPAPMNGEPGALAYVRGPDGRYHAFCLTVMSLDADGRVVELTTFVLPELFAAWGFPPVLGDS